MSGDTVPPVRTIPLRCKRCNTLLTDDEDARIFCENCGWEVGMDDGEPPSVTFSAGVAEAQGEAPSLG